MKRDEDWVTLDLRLQGYPMTRGEFRRALGLAHQGRIETGAGEGPMLEDLLRQITDKAPARDPKLDAAARRAYTIQAKYESGTLSSEHAATYDLVASGELSAADGLAVIDGTLTLTDGVLTPTLRDARPKTTRKRS